jgi:hypothetical protein
MTVRMNIVRGRKKANSIVPFAEHHAISPSTPGRHVGGCVLVSMQLEAPLVWAVFSQSLVAGSGKDLSNFESSPVWLFAVKQR